jgi:glycosyltransferase involved in cell wall biosynthesis
MISVCIATCNGEKYIKEQLNSILCQIGTEDEVVVSDDCSTDLTLDIIENYYDNRIKILRNSGRCGVVGNFENAIRNAKGDYIFLCDQDDVWLENKVQICLQALQNVDVVVSDCYIADAFLNITSDSFFQKNQSRKGFFNNLRHNGYIGCCMVFRKDVLSICLPFPKNIPLHDIWIGFVAELFYRSCFVFEPLILYRRHNANISYSSEQSKFGLLKKISFRWNLIKYIPLLFIRKMKK